MDDRHLNPLQTGVLFVAPGQIMDPGLMKWSRYPDHISRLRVDMGVDALEIDSGARPAWSIRQLVERIADLVRRREPAPT